MCKENSKHQFTSKMLACLGAFTLLINNVAFCAEYETVGKISNVELYTDRAVITRNAKVSISAGSHNIVMRQIPHGISAESITAFGKSRAGSGTNATIIRGVELKSVPLRDDVSLEIRKFEEKLAELTRERESLSRKKEMLERQRTLVANIKLDVPVSEQNDGNSRPRNAKEIIEILNLISDTESKLDPQFRKVATELNSNSKEIDLVKAELSKLQPQRRRESIIEIGVLAEQETELDLNVSYQLNGANWIPTYNLQVDGDKVTLEQFAVISQRTGEEWHNVKLTLSSARPQVGLIRPEPAPFILDIMRPQPMALRGGRAEMEAMAPATAAQSFAQDDASGEGSNDLAQKELAYQNAEISYGAVVEYGLPEPITLASDGTTQKVFLNSTELTAKIYNIAVPAINQDVFREAELINKTTAPLLPGELNIFNDGRFVGKAQIDLIQPEQKFKLSLGLAEQLQVNRKLVKRFEDDSGLIRQIRRIRDDFEIEIFNNSTKEAEILILEPVPLSRNELITVNIVDQTPQSKPDTDSARLTNIEGVLEWTQVLAPSSKSKITYGTVVEFPAKERVEGL